MTKTELIEKVATEVKGMPEKDVSSLVNAVLSNICLAIYKNRRFSIPGVRTLVFEEREAGKKKQPQIKSSPKKVSEMSREQMIELERRNYRRITFGFIVQDQKGNVLGTTKDVSLNGCFIETKDNFNKGDGLNISFELPDSLEAIKARCQVTWIMPDKGVGVKLIMDDKDKKIYHEFVKDYSF